MALMMQCMSMHNYDCSNFTFESFDSYSFSILFLEAFLQQALVNNPKLTWIN